jgi:tetratricopeptide (TPR) repeat protein
MTEERHAAVKRVFCQALELGADERAAFIHRMLADPAERAEVERLLRWHADDYLAAPALAWTEEPELVEGEQFGPYAIERELGRGGMGTVYLARRDDELAGYRVALKVIAAGEDDAGLEARLRAEMRALTRLRHPNIVSILDGGLSSCGRVYLAMEYIEGTALDVHCRAGALAVGERLKLFLGVCHAVEHAHRHLVVHRDLKPSNILVTADGVAKLVDFGLSRIVADGLDETLDVRLRLSPRYASPEQIRGEPLTTATDIYSLGVILYELLTGVSPYGEPDGAAALLHAVLAREPARPALEADLRAILVRALRKQPAARYGSVEEFARDVERYLAGRPVEARRGSFVYLAGKCLRRHAAAWAASAAIGVALLAAGASWWAAREARRNLDQALSIASALSSGLDSGFSAPGRGALAHMARQVGAMLIERSHRVGVDRQTRINILNQLTDIGASLGHPTTGVRLGDVAGGIAILREVVKEAEQEHAREPDGGAVGALVSNSSRALGSLLIEADDYAAAAALFNRVAALDGARARRFPRDAESLNSYADSLANQARIHYHARNAEACLRLNGESVGYRRRAVAAAPAEESPMRQKDLGHALSNYCGDLVEFGRYQETLAMCAESNAVLTRVPLPTARRVTERLVANNAEHVGRAQLATGHLREAIASFEDAVRRLRRLRDEMPADALSDRHLASCLSRLAEARLRSGRPAEARAAATEAVRLAGQLAAADPSDVKARLLLNEVRERAGRVASHAD